MPARLYTNNPSNIGAARLYTNNPSNIGAARFYTSATFPTTTTTTTTSTTTTTTTAAPTTTTSTTTTTTTAAPTTTTSTTTTTTTAAPTTTSTTTTTTTVAPTTTSTTTTTTTAAPTTTSTTTTTTTINLNNFVCISGAGVNGEVIGTYQFTGVFATENGITRPIFNPTFTPVLPSLVIRLVSVPGSAAWGIYAPGDEINYYFGNTVPAPAFPWLETSWTGSPPPTVTQGPC
jgi:hypothetical protein